jgi:integrase
MIEGTRLKKEPVVQPEKPIPRRKWNRMKFTEKNVLTLKAHRTKQYQAWDHGNEAARGLSVLVSPSGVKSFRATFYFNGSSKPHFKSLGRVGEMSLAEARELTRKARGDARKGIDPRADDVRKSDAFEAAIEDYIKHEQIGRHQNKSAGKTQKVILFNTKDWQRRPVATIRYQEVEKLLQVIRDGDDAKGLKPRPYLANRLYSHLKDFFGWCVRSKKIGSSPITDMERPWDGAKRRERPWFKKVLGDQAITALWRAANEIGGNEGKYLKAMILTGKRKSDLLSMHWEQIESDWFWDPPPSKSKNKRLHGVPLPDLARRVLHPRVTHGLVFEGVNLDRLQAEVRKRSGIEDFFWHGARHLVETKLGELRILPHIRDLLLDHVSQRGTGSVYDHHDYKPEMRTAMETWADHVEALVSAEGVALLR